MSDGTALNQMLMPLPAAGAWATGEAIDVSADNQIVFRVSYAPNGQASGPAVLLDVQWSNDRTRWSSCVVGQEASFAAGQDSVDSIVHRMFQFAVDPTSAIDQALLPFDCSKWAYCRVRAQEVGDATKPGAASVQYESSEIHQVDGLIQPFAWVSRLNGFVVGPASSTDGNLVAFDGTTGQVVRLGPVPPAGTIVGTSDSQTLTNKTIEGGTITDVDGVGIVLCGQSSQNNPAAGSSTYYPSINAAAAQAFKGLGRLIVPFDGTIALVRLIVGVGGTLGSDETFSADLHLNETSNVLISGSVRANARSQTFGAAPLQAVSAEDTIDLKIVTPATWATPPTSVNYRWEVLIVP